jgi:hypothetical protein
MDNNLVDLSLKYKDKNFEKYYNFFKSVKKVTFKKSDPSIQDIIELYDENGQLLLSSKYEYIGMYEKTTKSWIWGWAISSMEPKAINIIKKILLYGLNINLKDSDSILNFIKNELITSRFKIHSDLQKDIHIGIAQYIGKKNLIYEFEDTIDSNFVYYLFLLDDDKLTI